MKPVMKPVIKKAPIKAIKFNGDKTHGKWHFKSNYQGNERGLCGTGELDYNLTEHTSIGVKGSGCVGNPFADNPIDSSFSGGQIKFSMDF